MHSESLKSLSCQSVCAKSHTGRCGFRRLHGATKTRRLDLTETCSRPYLCLFLVKGGWIRGLGTENHGNFTLTILWLMVWKQRLNHHGGKVLESFSRACLLNSNCRVTMLIDAISNQSEGISPRVAWHLTILSVLDLHQCSTQHS